MNDNGSYSNTDFINEYSAYLGLKASLYGYDDVNLTWSKATNVQGYAIYYKNSKNVKNFTLWKVVSAKAHQK